MEESSTLILNTFDISISTTAGDYYNVTVDNEFGTIANNRCNLTWKNINIRRVLGEMYDKYETFNMHLYQINQSQAFSALSHVASAQSLLVDVRIKGLPFLNNTYNFVSKNNTNTAFLTSYLLNNNNSGQAGITTQLFNPSILTFGKGSESVDINIDIKTTIFQVYPGITAPVNGGLGPKNSFGTFIFMFKIYGVSTKTNKITNGSRM